MKQLLFPSTALCVLFCMMACHTAKPVQHQGSHPVAHPVAKPATPPSSTAASVPVAPSAANVSWLDSDRLMPVLEMASREKKLVFVEFYASWCAPCKVMEEDVFTQPAVSQYLNAHFLNFHTDFDSPAGRTIADLYEVEKIPTVLFLSPNGVVLERHLGIANPSLLFSLGDSALSKSGK